MLTVAMVADITNLTSFHFTSLDLPNQNSAQVRLLEKEELIYYLINLHIWVDMILIKLDNWNTNFI